MEAMNPGELEACLMLTRSLRRVIPCPARPIKTTNYRNVPSFATRVFSWFRSVITVTDHDTEDSSSKCYLQRGGYLIAPDGLTRTSSCRNAPAPTGPREQHDSGLLLAVSRPILSPACGVTDINEHFSRCPINESNTLWKDSI
jgi:hypothetical protein